MPTPPLPRPGSTLQNTSSALSRRTLLKAAVGLGALGSTYVLSGCAPAGSSTPVTNIRFFLTKPEVVGYFTDLISQFHDSQSRVRVTLDSTSLIAPQFVRDAPPDLACYNYNLETGKYVERGVLTDLGDLPEAKRIDPGVQTLVDQFGTYPGRTSVLPYSITAASTIYNKEIFAANNVSVPTTYTEFVAACETFKAAGIMPIYATYKDTWTSLQGAFDYTTGGVVDVEPFFSALDAEGTNVGPTSDTSFERNLADPVSKMMALRNYNNPDAGTRGYSDGNLAMAQGKAAMVFQGPWALGEIAKTSPDLEVGTFPLPMTDNPDDRRVRVNLDLALWIPTASKKQDAAREFLTFLMAPETINAYNAANLAFGTTTDAPAATDARITGMQEFVDRSAFYQGPGTYIPPIIPAANYIQAALASGDGTGMLRRLDDDWRRLALRS